MAEQFWGMPEIRILGAIARAGERKTRYAIATEMNLPVRTVYDAFERFERLGYVAKELERVDPTISGREPRVLFRATTMAADALNAIRLAVAEKQPA